MKRILATGSIAAFAVLGFAGTANAAPAESKTASCFGQVHKLVNSGGAGVDNVGQLVQSLDNKGQGKKALAPVVGQCA